METATRPNPIQEGVNELKERIARIQKELAEISAALDALGQEPDTQPERRTVDKAAALRAFDAMLEQMGIDKDEPIGAEALQQLMLDEGVNPEENAASRGIIAMREE